MKVSDFVARFLAENGVRQVFGVTGGAVVHLFDSVATREGMEAVFMHHEQAAAFAAEACARVTNGIGAAFVTTGPGGTNALTGLCAAWLDSIPCIYISGQTRLAHTTRGKPIRQVGTQQLDIVTIVKPMTKYAVLVEDVRRIRYELEKAVAIARAGRPGPVWVDIPLDFQWADIDPGSLESFTLPDDSKRQPSERDVQACARLLQGARRPLLLVGGGARAAAAGPEVAALLARLGLPYVATWSGADLCFGNGHLDVGRPGVFGQRGANYAVQNCDLLVSLGSHLPVPVTGTIFSAFAREASIVMVDADEDELRHGNVKIDLPINADAGAFLRALLRQTSDWGRLDIEPWRDTCARYADYNRAVRRSRDAETSVDPYALLDHLSDLLTPDDVVVVDGGGTINQVTFQAFRGKLGQRLVISGGLCSMGSGLPEAIGACLGSERRRTICLSGDGSFQFNVQELQTALHHALPLKLIVINNSGYLSIRHTQQGFLDGRFIGSGSEGGLTLPDISRVAEAYGIPAVSVSSHEEMRDRLPAFLEQAGPALCEVLVSPDALVSPRQGFAPQADGTFQAQPLENMAPFLDPDEHRRNMLVAPWRG